MLIGPDGWAVENAEGLPSLLRVPSVRSCLFAAELRAPLGLVWHWTGGPALGPAFATALAEEIRGFDRVKDRAASWHFLVAKNGRIFQSIQTDRGAWHVGRPGRIGGKPEMVQVHADPITGLPSGEPIWDAMAWPGRLFANINAATIGVELENSGRLEKVGERFYCWPFWLNPDKPESGVDPKLEVPADRAKLVGATWYDDYPQAQRDAAARLLSALVLRYRWTRDVCQYAHKFFDPTRKEDPGPAWMGEYLPQVLDLIFGPG